MTTMKMKGLLKGLRYISQIFDPKEHEMQIGFPTDVKHVAHIGWDGPAVSSPSWMNDFKSAPLSIGGTEVIPEQPLTRFPSHELLGNEDTPIPEPRDPAVPKPRRNASTSAAASADGSVSTRRSRRNKSVPDGGEGSNPGDSPAGELPVIPKVARKKKSKAAGTGEGGGGSSRSGKSRARASLSDGSGRSKEEIAEDFPTVQSPA